MSIPWLLMSWLLASPGHQQPWYWLCWIGRSLPYSRRNFNYLCLISVEEWHKILIYVYVHSDKFNTLRVKVGDISCILVWYLFGGFAWLWYTLGISGTCALSIPIINNRIIYMAMIDSDWQCNCSRVAGNLFRCSGTNWNNILLHEEGHSHVLNISFSWHLIRMVF